MSSSRPQDDKPPSSSNPPPSQSRQPQQPDPPSENGILSSVASSAAGLFESITRPTPSLTTAALNSAASSSSKSSQQQQPSSSNAAGSSSWSETASYHGRHGSHPLEQFRSQQYGPALFPTTEDDFTYFSASGASGVFPAPTSTFHPQTTFQDYPDDGAAVADLLSSPLATSDIYADDIVQTAQTLNISHPAVIAFAECEDPVEFLQSNPAWSQYTDSVWGDLLEVMKDAAKEVDKGKGKEDSRAVERLKLVWGHVRAKL